MSKWRINPDLLKAAQEFTSGNLEVPSDAKVGRNDQKRWSERLIIDATFLKEDDNGVSASVQFRVSPAGYGSINVNRRTFSRFNFDFEAEPGDNRHTMTAISTARMLALLKACGEDIEDNGFALDDFFGDRPKVILVGKEVNAVVVDKPDRDDKSVRRQEMTNFTATED